MTTLESGLPVQALIVPLDGSELSAAAARTAGRLAPGLNAAVHLVSVVSTHEEADTSRRQFDALAEAISGSSREIVMTDEHTPSVDEVALAILQSASGARSVVCMGSHGRGRSAGILGSVATEVTARARHPVAVVGPAFSLRTWRFEAPVVACIDGTLQSEATIPIALEWAHALGVPLWVVTVAEPIPAPLPGRPWRRMHGPDEDANRYMATVVERHRDDRVPIDGTVVYDPVSVAGGLVDHLATHPASLVTVATHARRGGPRLVFGSAAADIVHRVPMPVLSIPISRET